jgi:hypothetical protein
MDQRDIARLPIKRTAGKPGKGAQVVAFGVISNIQFPDITSRRQAGQAPKD